MTFLPSINGSTKIQIADGAGGFKNAGVTNIRSGISSALSGGAATVTDVGCTSSTMYFFSTAVLGTITGPVAYRLNVRTPGTGFTIQSANIVDTSTVNWIGVEP